MKNYVLLIFMTFFCLFGLSAAEDMLIHPEDIRLVYDDGADFSSSAGYHLYIRKKSGIESVMLVETTKDPEGKEDNYSYRALDYNSINGDEIRYLDGKVLDSKYSKYSLIDSTPEDDPVFGQAFHIFIPPELAYGYPWSRNGLVKIGRGTFINIRSFEKKYGDYSGSYADNAYMFDLGKALVKEEKLPPPEEKKEEPLPPVPEEPEVIVLTDDYNPLAAETFRNIAAFGGGEMVYSKGPDSLPDDIMASLDRIKNKEKADVVFAIDTTGSMKDDIQKLREVWVPQLIEKVKEFSDLRLGLLLYRDYGDTYRYMNLPVKKFDFTREVNMVKKNLNSFYIYGTEGGDIPEAVYEALYASMEFYKWRPDAERKIILIGDAEPHPRPRGSGKYSKELVAKTSEEKKIMIDAIIVPDNKKDRGR
ncbi:MAG: VWA domain-containing protein [Treponema sp.]|nr:VWA domain-containing protein [Treponema sp.]